MVHDAPAPSRRAPAVRAGWAARSALLPVAATAILGYLGATLWTLEMSVTASRTLPSSHFVGMAQYARLFTNERWLLSLDNLLLYGVLFIVACLVAGCILAVLVDREVAARGWLRSIFLYPYAMSFIATGAVWQWILNPTDGIQAVGRALGFTAFRFDWIVDPDRVLLTIVIATAWQASGFVMTILLAGLSAIDPDVWRAARIDGVPTWRVYTSIVLPQLGYAFATALVLLLTGVVKLYDAVVAMTQGGPGTASEVPTKFIMDHLYGRANLGLASAGAIVLLVTVIAVLSPFLYARARAARVAP